jgi:hypothetical protein
VELTCQCWGGEHRGCSVRQRLRRRDGRPLYELVSLFMAIEREGDRRTSKQPILCPPIHLLPLCHHLTPNLQLRRKRNLFPNLCNTPFISVVQKPLEMKDEDRREGLDVYLLGRVEGGAWAGYRCNLYGLGGRDVRQGVFDCVNRVALCQCQFGQQ